MFDWMLGLDLWGESRWGVNYGVGHGGQGRVLWRRGLFQCLIEK